MITLLLMSAHLDAARHKHAAPAPTRIHLDENDQRILSQVRPMHTFYNSVYHSLERRHTKAQIAKNKQGITQQLEKLKEFKPNASHLKIEIDAMIKRRENLMHRL